MKYPVLIICFFLAACHDSPDKKSAKPHTKLKAVGDLIPELQSIKLSPITLIYKSYGCFHYIERKMTIRYDSGEYIVTLTGNNRSDSDNVKKYFVDSSFINDLYRFGRYYETLKENEQVLPKNNYEIGTIISLDIFNGLGQKHCFFGNSFEKVYLELITAIKVRSSNSEGQKPLSFYLDPE